MTKTWRNRPTIINTIPNDKSVILFIDESGEGNRKILKKAFDDKKNAIEYKQRNDIYILNGIAITGAEHYLLQKRFDKIKMQISQKGIYNYDKKGIKPIVFRNHELSNQKPPFDKLTPTIYEKLNKIITITKFTQIAAGLNYYTYTQKNTHDEKSSPILMTLGLILINYAEYLNSIEARGIIIFEEETAKHDNIKLNYIKKILSVGNKSYNADFFKNISAIYFRKKWTEESPNSFMTTAGLELADLTISPLRRVLHPEFQLIERKLYNYPHYIHKGITSIN